MVPYNKKGFLPRIYKMNEKGRHLSLLYQLNQTLGGEEIPSIEEDLETYRNTLEAVYDSEEGIEWEKIEGLPEDEREELNSELDDVVGDLKNHIKVTFETAYEQASNLQDADQQSSQLAGAFMMYAQMVESNSDGDDRYDQIINHIESLKRQVNNIDNIEVRSPDLPANIATSDDLEEFALTAESILAGYEYELGLAIAAYREGDEAAVESIADHISDNVDTDYDLLMDTIKTTGEYMDAEAQTLEELGRELSNQNLAKLEDVEAALDDAMEDLRLSDEERAARDRVMGRMQDRIDG